MPSCLGIYSENNIIKYAKISKEHENVKIEAFGIKFYDNIDEAIKQIINETYSYKVPISLNLSDEKYTYADLFSLLNKKDLEKAIDTEFDYFCNENAKNRNASQYKRILVKNQDDKDKIRAMYVYTDKANIVSKLKTFDGLKINSIVPLPISISNLSNFREKKNSIIVNIEKETTVTTIIDGEIYRVDTIPQGMKEILDSITAKENSYAKAYEICKNTTIYTMEGKNLQTDENEYIEDIMPTLYGIIQKVRRVIEDNMVEISNIYITGLAAIINNIDLYFQENFADKKCEILVPYFAEKTNLKLNIKDYIEVNSATALALQGLGQGAKDINFKSESPLKQLTNLLTMDVGKKQNNGNKKESTKPKLNINFDFGKALDELDKNLIRLAAAILILIISYVACEKVILNKINNKKQEIQILIDDTQAQIDKEAQNTKMIESRTNEYEKLLSNILAANEKLTQKFASQNAIPNLLNNIMFIIPQQVQLTSIENTSEKHIIIQAQSEEYQQLGYFKAILKTDSILTDVTSTSGTKENGVVKVTIEGNLPY